jgi:hypothetical protein
MIMIMTMIYISLRMLVAKLTRQSVIPSQPTYHKQWRLLPLPHINVNNLLLTAVTYWFETRPSGRKLKVIIIAAGL